MEELETDAATVRQVEETERHSVRHRRRNRKKPSPLLRQQTQEEVRKELGLGELDACARVAAVVMVVLAGMAGIGAVMQAASTGPNKALATHAQEQQELNVGLTKEVFVMACQTTWQAARLWLRLIVAIVLPTSHQTFRITKSGFSAMQPSVRATWRLFVQSHWTTKAAIGTGVLAVVTAIILQREIRKRRYVERVQAWFAARHYAVTSTYNAALGEVRRESKILADLLPHVLFVGGSATAFLLFRAQFVEFSRSIWGWVVVIGLPILLSARALIVYDLAYRKKVEALHGQRRRTFSHFPTPESPETQQLNLASTASNYLRSFFRRDSQRVRGDSSEDDTSSVGSMDSNEVSMVDGIRYPRRLENDPQASLEQYDELHSVLYWLQYWTVMGLSFILEQLPLSGHMLSVLPFWPPVRVLWSLWLQFPGTSGASLGFAVVVPLIHRYIGEVSGPAVSVEQQNLLVNVLFAFRIIGPDTRTKMAEMLQTGGTVVMVALPFFFLPSVITGIGAVTIGLGRPILAGARVILAVERARKITEAAALAPRDADMVKRFRSNSVSITNGAVQVTQWLEYWVIYSLMMLVHGAVVVVLFWFPFYQHMLLCATLWLQLPYFRGAHNIFKVALKVFYKIRSYFVKDTPATGGLRASKARRGNLPPIDEGGMFAAAAAAAAAVDLDSEDDVSPMVSPREQRRTATSSLKRAKSAARSLEDEDTEDTEDTGDDEAAAAAAEEDEDEAEAANAQAPATGGEQQGWYRGLFSGSSFSAATSEKAAPSPRAEDKKQSGSKSRQSNGKRRSGKQSKSKVKKEGAEEPSTPWFGSFFSGSFSYAAPNTPVPDRAEVDDDIPDDELYDSDPNPRGGESEFLRTGSSRTGSRRRALSDDVSDFEHVNPLLGQSSIESQLDDEDDDDDDDDELSAEMEALGLDADEEEYDRLRDRLQEDLELMKEAERRLRRARRAKSPEGRKGNKGGALKVDTSGAAEEAAGSAKSTPRRQGKSPGGPDAASGSSGRKRGKKKKGKKKKSPQNRSEDAKPADKKKGAAAEEEDGDEVRSPRGGSFFSMFGA